MGSYKKCGSKYSILKLVNIKNVLAFSFHILLVMWYYYVKLSAQILVRSQNKDIKSTSKDVIL